MPSAFTVRPPLATVGSSVTRSGIISRVKPSTSWTPQFHPWAILATMKLSPPGANWFRVGGSWSSPMIDLAPVGLQRLGGGGGRGGRGVVLLVPAVVVVAGGWVVGGAVVEVVPSSSPQAANSRARATTTASAAQPRRVVLISALPLADGRAPARPAPCRDAAAGMAGRRRPPPGAHTGAPARPGPGTSPALAPVTAASLKEGPPSPETNRRSPAGTRSCRTWASSPAGLGPCRPGGSPPGVETGYAAPALLRNVRFDR